MSGKRGHRTAESRRLQRAVEEAGGRVEVTGKGHLRVHGPTGAAIISSAPGNSRRSGRSWANMVGHIRRHAGLDIKP